MNNALRGRVILQYAEVSYHTMPAKKTQRSCTLPLLAVCCMYAQACRAAHNNSINQNNAPSTHRRSTVRYSYRHHTLHTAVQNLHHSTVTTHNAEEQKLSVVQPDPDSELIQGLVTARPNAVQRRVPSIRKLRADHGWGGACDERTGAGNTAQSNPLHLI